MDVLVDASVLVPMVVDRQMRGRINEVIGHYSLQTPPVAPYEVGNALSRLRKRHLLNDIEVMEAYNGFTKLFLDYQKVDIKKALIIACQYLIYAYDAYYLEVAVRKNLPLMTLDERMKKVALDLKLTVLEV